MTTEQQARAALTVLLASVRVEGHHLDRAEDARKTLIDFTTQAAKDKRIADAVRQAAEGGAMKVNAQVGNSIVLHSLDGAHLKGQRILITPASVMGGE